VLAFVFVLRSGVPPCREMLRAQFPAVRAAPMSRTVVPLFSEQASPPVLRASRRGSFRTTCPAELTRDRS
jgi:hypothetical protein